VDSLIITGCQFGGTNTQIDINNILHPQVTGCYFLDTLYMFNITTPCDGTISGNQPIVFLQMALKHMELLSPEIKEQVGL